MSKTQFEHDIDGLREQVSAISKSVESLRNTGLRESVLCQLVQSSARRHMPSHSRNKLPMAMVKAVLDGIETFEEYMFPAETQ